MEKEMEKEKNFMRMEIYYLKVNIKMGKDGKVIQNNYQY